MFLYKSRKSWFDQSSKGISDSVCKSISNFLRRIVKKSGQKLILGDNFINKNKNDFYVLQLWFFWDFWIGLSEIAKNSQNGGFSQFLAIFDGPIQKC